MSKIVLGNCVMCGQETSGRCGEDILCEQHYVDHTYYDWLIGQGRGDELVETVKP